MDCKLPTSGQIERDLSQRVQKLYREELGHCPRKVTCKLFDNQLAIVIEDSLTILQKTLIKEDQQNEINRHLSLTINNIIRSKLKIAIEEILKIQVYEILFDSSLKSQQAGAIAILTQAPLIRKRDLIPKIRKNKSTTDESSPIESNTLASATESKIENI